MECLIRTAQCVSCCCCCFAVRCSVGWSVGRPAGHHKVCSLAGSLRIYPRVKQKHKFLIHTRKVFRSDSAFFAYIFFVFVFFGPVIKCRAQHLVPCFVSSLIAYQFPMIAILFSLSFCLAPGLTLTETNERDHSWAVPLGKTICQETMLLLLQKRIRICAKLQGLL